MEKWKIIALLLTGFGLLLAAVLIRARFDDKYELKTLYLVLLILPLMFVLLITDKDGLYVGMVERSQLTASLTLEVADKLETRAQQ